MYKLYLMYTLGKCMHTRCQWYITLNLYKGNTDTSNISKTITIITLKLSFIKMLTQMPPPNQMQPNYTVSYRPTHLNFDDFKTESTWRKRIALISDQHAMRY